MAERWIALHCGDEAEALQAQHPSAFLLLCQIARRAKWKDCRITKLKAGQALIGDWREAGLSSEKVYRNAKAFLAECGLATFEGRPKGTIATLMNKRIFSYDRDDGGEQGADRGRTEGEQGATNHTDTQNTQNTLTPFALDGASSPPPQGISWNFADGFIGITDKDRREWKEAFPAVNIDQQLAAASRWLKDNPAKRKKQVGRFITGWLSRHQERGGDIPSNKPNSYGNQQPKHSTFQEKLKIPIITIPQR